MVTAMPQADMLMILAATTLLPAAFLTWSTVRLLPAVARRRR
jgi:hypothetical protein